MLDQNFSCKKTRTLIIGIGIEFISDDTIKIHFWNCHILTRLSESSPQNRHMLRSLCEYCQNRLKYDHVETDNLPFKPLYFSLCSTLIEPGTKYSNLIGTMPAFNCLYLGHSVSD